MSRKEKNTVVLTEDEAQFIDDLISRNKSAIVRTINRTLGDYCSYLRDDCISETYLTACENIAKIKAHENPDGWIIKAARITALNVIKENHKTAPNIPLDDVLDVSDCIDVSEDAIFDIWIKDEVPKKLISELTKREQQVYYMIYAEEKSTMEVAKELGLKISTVWVINHAIKEKIKRAIEKKKF